MLKLKPSCEHCNVDLPPDSTQAMICSFECTFCTDCVDQVLDNVCPNCGGGFERRPIRISTQWQQGVSLAHAPASTQRVFDPVDPESHRLLSEKIRGIEPHKR